MSVPLVHYVKCLHRPDGKESALCYAHNRPIPYPRAVWTNRREHVTCGTCNALLNKRQPRAPRQPPYAGT